ncbi:MAG: TlpA family protein disulfide reductase [Polaromonas sp.]
MTTSHSLSGALSRRRLTGFAAAMVLWGVLGAPMLAQAQAGVSAPAVKAVTQPQVEGKTIDGAPFKLSSLKGKVVMVMFWSTSCAVCRDKMPELRNNYEGWNGKPFELVVISTDKRVQDLLDYERIITRTVPLKQRFVQLWSGESGYKDNLGTHAQLPAAYLLDKSGSVVERYTGRIPADAWDRIADLL